MFYVANESILDKTVAKLDSDHLFLFVGEFAFTLEELGPIADLPLTKALQAILDTGFMGDINKGRPWHEVFRSSGMELEKAPEPHEELQYKLYRRYHDAIMDCRRLSAAGLLTDDHKDEMLRLRKEWKVAEKLSKS